MQEEEGDGLSILSGSSGSTSGSALSSSDSGGDRSSSNEKSFTNILKTTKSDEGQSLNGATFVSSKGSSRKTTSRKYKQSKDGSTK